MISKQKIEELIEAIEDGRISVKSVNYGLPQDDDITVEEAFTYRVSRIKEIELPEPPKEQTKMRRFEDNDNGTVTDIETKLVWQKDHADPLTWQETMNYAESLSLAGHNDWRLPTAEELFTLVDFSKHSPASSFPEMLTNYFWTSSSYAPNSDYAWGVDFSGGYVYNVDKNGDHYVRCVRP